MSTTCSSANSVKKPCIERNCCFLFSVKRSYYSGEQHKLPGSKNAEKGKFLNKLWCCVSGCKEHDVSPKLCSDILKFLHEGPTSVINNTVMNDKILCCSRKYPYPSLGRFFSLNHSAPPDILF